MTTPPLVRWDAKPSGRTRRTLLERLVMAAPPLGRVLLSRVTRLPAGTRLRRWVLTRFVCDGLAANNRSDYNALRSLLHPELELRVSADDPGGLGVDLQPLYTGPDGYVEASEVWKSSFSDFHWDIREVLDPGGKRFAALTQMVGRGAGSGVEVSMPLYNLWEIEDGMLRRQWTFGGEDALLEFMGR